MGVFCMVRFGESGPEDSILTADTYIDILQENFESVLKVGLEDNFVQTAGLAIVITRSNSDWKLVVHSKPEGWQEWRNQWDQVIWSLGRSVEKHRPAVHLESCRGCALTFASGYKSKRRSYKVLIGKFIINGGLFK